MSTHITTRRLTLSLAAAAAALALTALGPAQQDAPDAQEAQDDNSHNLTIVTLDFPGGTVQDYVAHLQEARDDVNIMLDREAGSIAMPPVQLRNVMVIDALWLLHDLRPADGQYSVQVDDFHSGPPGLTAPVYRVSVQQQQRPTRPQQPESITAVWSVRHLLDEGMKSEDILSAVETALSLQEDLGTPEVRFHEATGLIIARADPRQTVSIDDVVERLRPAGVSRIREFETMIEELQRQVAALKQENSSLRQQIAAIRSRDERGGNTEGDIRDQQ